MKCQNCHSDNEEGVLFCEECGTKMELDCPNCGKKISPGKKFCGKCGHELAAPAEQPLPREPSFVEKLKEIQGALPGGLTEEILAQRGKIEGERKQVTVMFCDMEGYTSLSEKLDPEEVYSLMDEVYELLIHSVHEYGGTVNELTGDGIVALFGAPIAQEDAPQRAIRSALAVHREMVRFNDSRGKARLAQNIPAFRMRVGIHTGPVVVGTVGNDLRVEFKAVGDTVNLASRMEAIAEAGTTYVTDVTFKLTEGLFRFEAMGEREIKGKEEPVRAYRVIAPSARRTRFDVNAERGLTPFIGREKELELLLDGYQRARDGRGQAFSIVAEAGVGKSRLLYEFRKAVTNEDATFLEGRCLSYSGGTAYHPVIDLLKSNFDIHDADDELEIREKVKKGLKTIESDDSSTLPYLLELLGVEDSGTDMRDMSPEVKKKRTFDALKQIVLKGSEMRPLIMAVEDLHWSDPTSEDTFKYLLDNISGANVLLVFTYRPEFVHTWGGKSYHNQLNLNRLSNRESLAMVTNLLGTEDVERDLEEIVLEKTEGVPFFIEELMKSLKELQIIERKDGRYCRTKDAVDVAIPSTIQDVIMARVDSLPDEAKSLLQTGSVIGREFSYDLIKNVTGLPDQELLSNLSALKDAELLYERGIFPQSSYIFKHALTQDVVSESILNKRKKELHAQTGEAIEELHADRLEEFYELLAHHYSKADLIEQAIPYWQQAGQRAIQRSAYAEAVSHLTKGLELLETLPDTPERNQQELVLQTILGPALIGTKGYASQEVEQTFTRARELCRQVGDASQLFPVLLGLRVFYAARGYFQTALELSNQLLEMARSTQNKAHIVEAARALGAAHFHMGEFDSAREQLDQGIEAYDPQRHRLLPTSVDSGFICHGYSSWSLCCLGYPDKALKRSYEMLTLARSLSHPLALAHALPFTTLLYQFLGERQTTQELAEECIAISTKHGFPIWLIQGTIMHGWAMSEQGRDKEGISQMLKGIADLQVSGFKALRPYFLTMLIEAYGKVGQIEEGLSVIEEALALVDKPGERWFEADIHRIKGELLLAQSEGNQAEAESCFNKALDVARGQQAKSWELRAAMSLSRLRGKQGKRREARDLLAPVYYWFTEGFDTADLKEAKTLLEELS